MQPFLKTSVFSTLGAILINFDKFVGFSNDQIKMMISFLHQIMEDHDFALQVVFPERIELLLVNIFTI